MAWAVYLVVGFLMLFGLPIAALVIVLNRTGSRGPLARRIQVLENELQLIRAAMNRRQETDIAPTLAVEPTATQSPDPVQPPVTQTARTQPPEPVQPVAKIDSVSTWSAAAIVKDPSRMPANEPAVKPAKARLNIDLEQWLGVRGAAVLGSIVLGLAGLLFFKYSIEHDLISPTMRLVLGIAIGIACIAASHKTRAYSITSNALAGAGVVVLYGAFWAAKMLYDLVPMEVAFGLMALTTVACCVLAVRYASITVALLGLVGGFATPLLLASGEDRPISLFSYTLLLDAGFLYIAHKRGWAVLAIGALGGTVLLQGLWFSSRLDSQNAPLALVILGAFAMAFVLGSSKSGESGGRLWSITQSASVMIPFYFAFDIALQAEFGAHLYPIALLLGLLVVASGWLTHKMPGRIDWLRDAAAIGCLVVIAAWVVCCPLFLEAIAWEVALCVLAIAALFHGISEVMPAGSKSSRPDTAALIVQLGSFANLISIPATLDTAPVLWPWLVGWLGLLVMMYRQAWVCAIPVLQVLAAVMLGLGMAVFYRLLLFRAELSFAHFMLVALALSILLLVPVAMHRGTKHGVVAGFALAAFVSVMLLSLLGQRLVEWDWVAVLLSTTALAAVAAVGSALAKDGLPWMGIGACLALVHAFFTYATYPFDNPPHFAGLMILAVVVLAALPHVARARFEHERFAWIVAALAPVVWLFILRRIYVLWLGNETIGLLPIGLAVMPVLGLWHAREIWPQGSSIRHSVMAWYGAAALGLLSVAVPMQLDKEWITIGWAIEAFAVVALWLRLNHPGLKWFAFVLCVGVFLRLILNEEVLAYHDRGPSRVSAWLVYTYWLPVISMLGIYASLAKREVERAMPWEQSIYRRAQPVVASAIALAAIILVFAWLNLAIQDWFATGTQLTLSFERQPAKDLTTSIAWALYACVLLGIGMSRQSPALRWVSLVFFIVTIAKVGLYDLAELEDLYRVMSLLGLAIALIGVSFAYQRFVFRRKP